jgi:uncharacterized RDD family membrane protein YckC
MEPNESREVKQDLFDDTKYKLVQASHAKRFGNYIIDLVAFNILFFIGLMVAANIDPQVLKWVEKTTEQGFAFTEQLLILVVYGTYMFMVEALFKGKSLGKLITGTRVLRQDGNPITVRDAQLRGLCRMIPFHPFSALGMPCYPWHDRWTKTFVIDEKASSWN